MFLLFVVCLPGISYSDNLESVYKDWVQKILSGKNEDIANPHYHVEVNTKEIFVLGPRVLPYVYDSFNNVDAYLYSYLSHIMQCICKKSFWAENGQSDERMDYSDSYAKLWIQWWEKDRFDIAKQFVNRYTIWKQESMEFRFMKPTAVDYILIYSKDENKYRQWKKMPDGLEKKRLDPLTHTAYQQLLDLGIVALPFAVEKIKEGDADLIEAVNYWTDDALKKSAEEKEIAADAMREYCVKWWEENKENWLLPPVEEKTQQ
jgi:hypothetical protein